MFKHAIRRLRFILLAIGLSANSASLEAKSLYWSDENSIRSIDLDGANPRLLVSGVQGVTQLAIDLPAGRMYWAQRAGVFLQGSIHRANLDGTSPEPVVQGIGVDGGIVVDSPRNKLYWGGTLPDPERLGLNATRLDDLSTQYAYNVRLDVTMFFLHPGGDRLHMVDTDDGVLFEHHIDGAPLPFVASADAFAYGPGGQSIYWVQGPHVMTATLNGESIREVASYPVFYIEAIAVDPDHGIFLAAGNSIYRANLDGSNFQEFYRAPIAVLDIVIVPEPSTAIIGELGLALALVCKLQAQSRKPANLGTQITA